MKAPDRPCAAGCCGWHGCPHPARLRPGRATGPLRSVRQADWSGSPCATYRRGHYFNRRARPAWAWELSQNPFDNGRRNLEDALHRDCKGRRGEGPSVGFPSFHKRGSNEACAAGEGHPERIRMDGCNIRLPKVGWGIRAESLPDHDGGRPLQVHVRRAAGSCPSCAPSTRLLPHRPARGRGSGLTWASGRWRSLRTAASLPSRGLEAVRTQAATLRQGHRSQSHHARPELPPSAGSLR